MFTGIVKGYFPVSRIEKFNELNRITVQLPPELLDKLEIGASIAVNGCCLTVVAFDQNGVSFDAMKETLRVTNLGVIEEGSKVNIERAARFGDEIGGHLLSGHIHDTVEICDVIKEENNVTIFFKFDSKWKDYILSKGYVSLNGCSLTIGDKVEDDRFCVHLIPETLKVTCFGTSQVGDRINLEIDSQTQAIVATVKSYLGG
ncbi:riboflavin synthase subunit alpha [uncultured Endozoicomonas sp.]|uniref:riboflavin synthase subunit alpha n=1 Tax=uncultured Endozoicomonas sp. TaxID=432652 RepID=UPI002635684F|nr:riboflavin synthase subunit alpha [uncultured Endozoicomonas sp.]